MNIKYLGLTKIDSALIWSTTEVASRFWRQLTIFYRFADDDNAYFHIWINTSISLHRLLCDLFFLFSGFLYFLLSLLLLFGLSAVSF